GNGGTAGVAVNVQIAADDIDRLAALAREEAVDLTVVGPEAPLVAGIVDRFADEGLHCYGPRRAAARLEGSKVFAKEFMRRHGIPTAAFAVFDDAEAARVHVRARSAPMVVKADGLAAGKGVTVAATREEALRAVDEAMVGGRFGEAGRRVLVEDCLAGEEVSIHAVCAGTDYLLLPSSQDHKRALDGDRGPNTGGMGAYAPVPSFGEREMAAVRERVVEPTLAGMAADGSPFTGTLYAGLMRTPEGPMVLEYNVRFGDPETQVLLPMIRGDVFDLLHGAARGELPADVDVYHDRAAATVVMAARGYPGSYRRGDAIEGIGEAEGDGVAVFHAGTARDGDRTVTAGGRVLAVTAWRGDIGAALEAAYAAVSRVRFEGAFWRSDIGRRAIESGSRAKG
ncbi:MAG: phosphoribosylamine--glycine ligase, partial [Candidatus Krumholzibacteria bacterium]|nr:phosphoribosylamine--glycine ligase [Candidatus Krumholzibacteria bacterium]